MGNAHEQFQRDIYSRPSRKQSEKRKMPGRLKRRKCVRYHAGRGDCVHDKDEK